jgi:hypothetical protein
MKRMSHGPRHEPAGRAYALYWDYCPRCAHTKHYTEAYVPGAPEETPGTLDGFF